MILFLDHTLGLDIGGMTGSELNALELIAQAACKGNHLVLMDASLSEILVKHPNSFSSQASAFFRREFERFSTSPRHLLRQASVIFQACTDSCITVVSDGSQMIIKCPLRFFDSLSVLQPLTLACEDLYDFDLLVSLANYYRSRLHLQGFEIRAVRAHCGGSGAERVIKGLLDEGKIFLVITDSDKCSSSGGLGGTTQGVIKVLESTQHQLHSHIVLNCREVENLLPDYLLAGVFKQSPRSSALIHRFSEAGLDTPRLYGDLKEGITLQQMREYLSAAPSDKQDIFVKIIEEAAEQLDPFCLTHEDCKVSKCTCLIFPSNGGKESTILKRSIKELVNINSRELWEGLCEAHLRELDRVLSAIVFWGLASNAVRA